MTNSFYDPDCGANLFKSSPVYQFDHKPTAAIISAVKSGTLVDMVGNIMGEVEGAKAGEVDLKAFEAQVRANVETEIRAQLDSEYKAKMEVEVEKIKAELKAEYEAELAKATPVVEEVKAEEKVEDVADATKTAAAKKK